MDVASSKNRCTHCKVGGSSKIVLSTYGCDGNTELCPNCGELYKEEPNTNLDRKVYLFKKRKSSAINSK